MDYKIKAVDTWRNLNTPLKQLFIGRTVIVWVPVLR